MREVRKTAALLACGFALAIAGCQSSEPGLMSGAAKALSMPDFGGVPEQWEPEVGAPERTAANESPSEK